MTEVLVAPPFKRRIKALEKRYRQIKLDIQPIIEALQSGEVIGDRIAGTDFVVFKVRVKNSDIPTGKSGGYRIIYQLIPPECVALLIIYAKSDLEDITLAEIEQAIYQV
jgi:mRNA-degrading endonuclease RelE of RelBE toxin-antitoxin system